MSQQLAIAFINPYTLAKSRTGGVIARYIARAQLDFVGARMYSPSLELAEAYAEIIASSEGEARGLLSDYVRRGFAPDPKTGNPRRVMMLLFRGDDAIRQVRELTGPVVPNTGTGQTVRDTYGDYVTNEDGDLTYFEPAVVVGAHQADTEAALRLWAAHAESHGGLVAGAGDVPKGGDVERTLVLLKPDNFRFRSLRPGNIIDVLSRSGLRIVCVNKFNMTVAQAQEFYGPVREVLTDKFGAIGGGRVTASFEHEFGFTLPEESRDRICEIAAPFFADSQFEQIVQFMTGYKPSECPDDQKAAMGKEECLALVYEGPAAVSTIRGILGPTDPSRAEPGSVRREFGSNIMVNAAHASDSPDNAVREMGIIRVEDDRVRPLVEQYVG